MRVDDAFVIFIEVLVLVFIVVFRVVVCMNVRFVELFVMDFGSIQSHAQRTDGASIPGIGESALDA